MTVEEFREEALAYLQTYIKEHWDSSLIRAMEKTLGVVNLPRPLRDTLVSLDIKEYTVVEEDRMIIFTTEIVSFLIKEELAEVKAEDFAKNLIKQFNWIDVDMQEVEGDVVIWGKFKVDF